MRELLTSDFWLLGKGRWVLFWAFVLGGAVWPRSHVLEITSTVPGQPFVIVGSPGFPFDGEAFRTPMRVKLPRGEIEPFYVAMADGSRVRVAKTWRRFGDSGTASTTGPGWVRVQLRANPQVAIRSQAAGRDGPALVLAADTYGDDASRLFLGEGVRCSTENRLEHIGDLSPIQPGPSCDDRLATRDD